VSVLEAWRAKGAVWGNGDVERKAWPMPAGGEGQAGGGQEACQGLKGCI
jgi:hypothetical protein